jgi:hypothetical protein
MEEGEGGSERIMVLSDDHEGIDKKKIPPAPPLPMGAA